MVSKLKLNFKSKDVAMQFAESLGTKLEFDRTIGEEKKLGPVLYYLVYVLAAAFITIFLGGYDGEVSESSSKKSRLAGFILRLLFNTIGQTGIVIIGVLVTLYFIYKLFKRYKQPVNDVTFKKK